MSKTNDGNIRKETKTNDGNIRKETTTFRLGGVQLNKME
jgi:hypothetical protein